jgi:putative redox protein
MDILTVKMQTIDDKAKFSVTTRDNPELISDYFPPIGTGKGYCSMELLMIAFGTCVSNTLMALLRYRMKKTIIGLSAEVKGNICDDHPKVLQNISLLLKIKSNDITETEVQEALKETEINMSPVWAMIKGNVNINVETELCLSV